MVDKMSKKSFASVSLEMVYQQQQSLFQLTPKVEVPGFTAIQVDMEFKTA